MEIMKKRRKGLPENVIEIRNLGREFRNYKREGGFIESFKNIFNREYRPFIALRDINLDVKKGEIIGLIGPNGAGKSTLIKILSGVLYPSSGTVKVLGFTPWKDRIRYAKHLGVVFGQKSQLWYDLPAIDSFILNKSLYDIPTSSYNKRLKMMIDLLGIKDLMKKPVRSLSLGERMRCEIVQSLLHNPELVFFDEPTIGLDIIAKERMRDFIKEMNEKYGTTFIITTHDMDDIEKLCKRVVIINYGKIIYDGPLKDIRTKIANRKVLDCKFSEENVPPFFMKGCRTISIRPHQRIIELDLSKNNLRKVLDRLMKKYSNSLEDLGIMDPPIEEIIAQIYKK